ncbi:hypothetical protein J2S25_003825 [Mesobacillus stamsii]|uniref:Uncharacterized protein n=1 Tax=Mesobacillus stamsii TaxID=225347 RepID=A0ABU0G1V8_9BACI|nr:hypothetical protein [Mesobacillus stamsii]
MHREARRKTESGVYHVERTAKKFSMMTKTG